MLPFPSASAERPSVQRAYTIVELLVAIGIVGALIAIILPVLTSSMRRATEVVSLANIRSTSVTFILYAENYNGFMPYAPPDSVFLITPPDASEQTLIASGFWDLSLYWASLFHDVAPWTEHYRTWVVKDVRRDPEQPWLNGPRHTGIPSFEYCRSMFAQPELWSGIATSEPGRLLRAVRQSSIRFPSSKVFLFDGEATLRLKPGEEVGKIAQAFSDGHAANVDRDTASDPVLPATNDVEPRTLHDTVNGSNGRDYP